MKHIMEFNDVIKKGDCIVMFSSKQCQPCKIVTPILEELTKEAKIKFLKINVEESPKIATKYSVMSVPSTFLFKNGKVIKNIYGNPGKVKLRKLVNNLKN